ncbi:MAG: aminopeptidase P family protein [Firmicutes bacterium HGW-Firmicutes-20]|nr:MAG: aminopeptidase P family protein [Firmicutes bacterium HGW-Firmicutes-20]PKM69918.1 MAG: aminopeptidase P family protein [Firmicutes bacterium HGW-Firmicutes-19]
MKPLDSRIREFMLKDGVDIVLAQSPENFAYVSGFSAHQHAVSRQPGFACAIVSLTGHQTILIGMDFETPSFDNRNFDVRSFSTWVGNRTLRQINENLISAPFVTMLEQLVESIVGLGAMSKVIGIEMEYLPAQFYLQLLKRLPDAQFVDVSRMFLQARVTKQPHEIEFMRKLIRISDEALLDSSKLAKEGVMESELFRHYCQKVMASGIAFPSGWSSFTAGANAGKLGRSQHYRVTAKDVIKFDGGVNGDTKFYTTDFSRSWLMSDVDPWLIKIKQNLIGAHALMLDAIKPGISFKKLFHIGFDFTAKEFPFYQRGHLGHSISMGPQTAEFPFISSNQEGVLEPGMILAVENPMYITGFNGFNIEDMVLITEDGFELLTPLTPHWLESESKYR